MILLKDKGINQRSLYGKIFYHLVDIGISKVFLLVNLNAAVEVSRTVEVCDETGGATCF
jgi:hypothetical protein